MNTDLLRARIAAGAASVTGARLWPNGIGFSARGADYMISERPERAGQWMVNTTRGKFGYGSTPQDARANAKPLDND